MLISLVLTLICTPMANTIVRQVMLMVPGAGDRASVQKAFEVGRSACQSIPRINNAVAQLHILAQRTPDARELDSWASADSFNSLPKWAALLVELRNADIAPETQPASSAPAASQPSESPAAAKARINDLLAEIRSGPSLQIGLARLRDTFVAAVQDRGIDVRMADSYFEMEKNSPVLSAYRPVVRELTQRMMGLGAHYRRMNRPKQAAHAYYAAITALTDCVQDSPLPDVALLAAEQLHPVLQGLQSVSTRLDKSQLDNIAANLERFHRSWLEVGDRDINLLPVTFGPVLARSQHVDVLRSMSAATLLLGMGWIGAIICLVQLFVIATTQCFGPVPLSWRWGLGGLAAGLLIVLTPSIVAVCALSTGWVPFIYLFSLPSVNALVLAVFFFIVLVVTAGRICVTAVVPAGKPALPGTVIAVGLILILVASGIAAARVLSHTETWRPPLSVQLFRGISIWGGAASALVLMVWFVWGFKRGRKQSLRPGMRARANLAIAAPLTVAFLSMAAIALLLNTGNDAEHKTAFAQALADPIGDRLGSDWFKTYFQPALNLADSWK